MYWFSKGVLEMMIAHNEARIRGHLSAVRHVGIRWDGVIILLLLSASSSASAKPGTSRTRIQEIIYIIIYYKHGHIKTYT